MSRLICFSECCRCVHRPNNWHPLHAGSAARALCAMTSVPLLQVRFAYLLKHSLMSWFEDVNLGSVVSSIVITSLEEERAGR